MTDDKNEPAGGSEKEAGPSRIRRSPRLTPPPAEVDANGWEDSETDKDDVPISPRRAVSRTSTRDSVSTPTRTPKRDGSSRKLDSPTPSRRMTSTPVRRRKPPRARPLVAPRPRAVPLPAKPPWISGLTHALQILLLLLRFAVSFISILLGPILTPAIYTITLLLALSAIAYFILPYLPSLVLRLLSRLLRLAAGVVPWTSISSWSDSDLALARNAAILPFEALLATPSCFLFGTLCSHSLSTSQTPWWTHQRTRGDTVDKTMVARKLIKQGQMSKDIFDSIRAFREDGLATQMNSVAIWQLGVTVVTGSTIDEKDMIGQQLFELGDLTRDLYDDVRSINNKAVDAFTWVQWDLSALHQLLSRPEPLLIGDNTLQKRLHSLILRLDSVLADLYSRTNSASDTADVASQKGKSLLFILNVIENGLARERRELPIWKRAYDEGKHALTGGEPPKSALLRDNLAVTRGAIGDLDGVHAHLEDLREKLVDYRDQVGAFKASMMGVHLGTPDEEGGLGMEEEMMLLERLVGEFGEAVGRAKERPMRRAEGVRPKAIDG